MRNRRAVAPVKVLDIELSDGIRPVWMLDGYEALHALVRYRGQPVGWARVGELPGPHVPAAELRLAIERQLGWDVAARSLLDSPEVATAEKSGPAPLAPISVVVCTRDRTDQLALCLQALLALDYPAYEILVVDNAPRTDDTARLAAGLPVRYVREERTGLDWARNRGILEARFELIAFTDDDARPDRQWLRAIAGAFEDSQVMAVTGLVAPAELETEAQVRFELDYGGMGHGFYRRRIERSRLSDSSLLWASGFGVGANMAFRRAVFDAVGPFDTALDVGTPSDGGGDVEMFHRLVAHGHVLQYEPAALVWHTHRREMTALGRQINANGRSIGAYLLTCARNRTVSRFSILRFVIWSWLVRWILRRLLYPAGFPRRLVASELGGVLSSPWAYRAAQIQAKRLERIPPSASSVGRN